MEKKGKNQTNTKEDTEINVLKRKQCQNWQLKESRKKKKQSMLGRWKTISFYRLESISLAKISFPELFLNSCNSVKLISCTLVRVWWNE